MATVLDILRSTPPNLAVALDHARAGIGVFPCHPETNGDAKAKSPRVRWQEAATTDEAAIRAWWTAWPDSLVGLHLAAARLMAIDADRHGGPDGVAAWEVLATANGFDPALYPAVETPGRGRHVYMRRPAGVEPTDGRGRLPAGVDVRGAGYTIAAGCVLPDGRRYAPAAGTPPLALDIPDAPAWLCGTIGVAHRAADTVTPVCELDTPAALAWATTYLREAPPAIEGQGGDAATVLVASVLKDGGISSDMALDLMAEHWNERCAPPWSVDELAIKVENAFRYGQNPPGSASPAVDFAGVDPLPPLYITRKSRLRWLSDADAQKQPEWLMRPWLPEVGVATIAGQSRAAKTFVGLDLAHALAMRETFFGKPARERVGVLFIAAEAPGTIGPRLEALRLYKLAGVDPSRLPVAWVDLDDVARPPDLSTRVAIVVAAIEADILDAAAEMQRRFGLRLGAVIVDTVGAAFGAADSDDEAAKLVMGALGVLSRKTGALVLPVAHFGKDDSIGHRRLLLLDRRRRRGARRDGRYLRAHRRRNEQTHRHHQEQVGRARADISLRTTARRARARSRWRGGDVGDREGHGGEAQARTAVAARRHVSGVRVERADRQDRRYRRPPGRRAAHGAGAVPRAQARLEG